MAKLNEQVRRNARRFPDDFSYQLTAEETLMSQFAISKGHSEPGTVQIVAPDVGDRLVSVPGGRS